jgi:putative ABC transport system permease protein
MPPVPLAARVRSWLAGSREDLRFCLRALARHPGFSLAAILTLALGIGATAAVWSVVQAVLLSALPYPQAERMVQVQATLREGGKLQAGLPVSYGDFYDWEQNTRVFSSLQVYSDATSFSLATAEDPERVLGEMVSGGYFPLLGVKAARGRTLTADDELPDAAPVVVVSHELAERRAGKKPSLLGATLRLNGRAYEVVGILPAGFKGLSDHAELWLPISDAAYILTPRHLSGRGIRWLFAAGRLEPGVSLPQAQQEMDRIAANSAREYPITNDGMGVRLVPLAEAWFGDLRSGLMILLAGAACVLLLACTNVAGLLLARAAARQREISIRTVLGAHRAALVRQLLIESVVLSCAGCAIGLLLAHWGSRLLVAGSAVDLRSFVRLGVNLPVVAVIVAVAVVCALLFGLAPAWLGSRPDLRGALQESGKGTPGQGRHRFLAGVVVSEIALAIILLVGAGLLIEGFRELHRTRLGFRPDGLLTVRLVLKGERYKDRATARRLARRLGERLALLPGVQAAAMTSPDLPTDDWHAYTFFVENRRDAPAREETFLVVHSGSPGYFKALGTPLVRGRDFTAGDDEHAPPVVVLSQEAAQRFWPGQDPLGKRLRIADVSTPWLTVVGVAADVRHAGLSPEPRPGPDVYYALYQSPPHSLATLNFVIRPARQAPAAVLSALRREVRSLAPELPLYDVSSMQERLARQTARDRFLTAVLGLFAAFAMVLAAVGIYGVVSYTVEQRRAEIGIRMALGARRRDVFGQMLRRGAVLALAGLAAGVTAALALAPLLGHFLHGVAASDPGALLSASLLLAAVVLAANCVPSWRASRIEPAKTLRID